MPSPVQTFAEAWRSIFVEYQSDNGHSEFGHARMINLSRMIQLQNQVKAVSADTEQLIPRNEVERDWARRTADLCGRVSDMQPFELYPEIYVEVSSLCAEVMSATQELPVSELSK